MEIFFAFSGFPNPEFKSSRYKLAFYPAIHLDNAIVKPWKITIRNWWSVSAF